MPRFAPAFLHSLRGDGVENKEDFAQCGGGEGGGRDQGGAQDTPYIFIVRGAGMEA